MKYLLDTCVVSELIAKEPDAQVIHWVDSFDDERAFLSVITIGEIQRGIEKLPPSQRKSEILAWFENSLLPRFDGRIIPIGIAVMLTWGGLVARLEQQGRVLPAIDSLIAAIALNGGLTLVTRNTKDFVDTGVTLFNPWKG